jgi:metal-responsive CopG/Arc/MetJ family transcriptional regulator
MRTTIEITEEQHAALNSLARRRGLRGFSAVVQDAITAYLQDLAPDEIDLLLGLEGTLTDHEERELRTRIDAARATWRAS